MDDIIVKISSDYTKSPGGRFSNEGKYSGEDFRNTILKLKYEESLNLDCKLIVNLDGGFGYAPSFLEEAFGGLVRELKDIRIKDIQIISEEEPKLIEDIKKYITEALEDR